MISFGVSHNGHHLCTASVGNHGVLSAIVTWTSRDHAALAAIPAGHRETAAREELQLQIGGLAHDVHHDWPSTPLQPGEEVLVRISESPAVDPPSDSRSYDPEQKIADQRDYVRRMCEQWGWHLAES